MPPTSTRIRAVSGSALSVSSRALLNACGRLGLDTDQILAFAGVDSAVKRDIFVIMFAGSSGMTERAVSPGPDGSASRSVHREPFAHAGAVDERIAGVQNHARAFREP